jgi:hypothetical protein
LKPRDQTGEETKEIIRRKEKTLRKRRLGDQRGCFVHRTPSKVTTVREGGMKTRGKEGRLGEKLGANPRSQEMRSSG